MPLYHFHVLNEIQGASLDQDGTEFLDPGMAKREAIHLAGALIAESASTERCPETWHVEVTDYQGAALFNLDFVIRAAPDKVTRHPPLMTELHDQDIASQ